MADFPEESVVGAKTENDDWLAEFNEPRPIPPTLWGWGVITALVCIHMYWVKEYTSTETMKIGGIETMWVFSSDVDKEQFATKNAELTNSSNKNVALMLEKVCENPIFGSQGQDSREPCGICRSRQEFSNWYVVAAIGFDAAESRPFKV